MTIGRDNIIHRTLKITGKLCKRSQEFSKLTGFTKQSIKINRYLAYNRRSVRKCN